MARRGFFGMGSGGNSRFSAFPGGFFRDFTGGDEFSPFPHSRQPVDNDKYYRLLGVEKSIPCSEVRKAFRDVAKTKHPDKGGDPKVFAEISQAASVLSDPKKREVYDKYGEEGLNKGIKDAGGPGFGGAVRERKKPKAPPLTIPLEVTMEEVYSGCRKTVEYNRTASCVQCKGHGYLQIRECPMCKGQGKSCTSTPFGMVMTPCDMCTDGTAGLANSRCPACATRGFKDERHSAPIEVEKGVQEGFEYIIAGEGDYAKGKDTGDVTVRVHVKQHSAFKRRGADLQLSKTLTLAEALAGYSFVIRHLDDTEHLFVSRPGDMIKPGDIRTVEDLGLPVFRDPIKHGSLFLRFEVDFPPPNFLIYDAAERLRSCFGPENDEVGPMGTEHWAEPCKAGFTEARAKTVLDREVPKKQKERRQERRPPAFVFSGPQNCSGTIF
jgi:DnaJ family protein A protein 2